MSTDWSNLFAVKDKVALVTGGSRGQSVRLCIPIELRGTPGKPLVLKPGCRSYIVHERSSQALERWYFSLFLVSSRAAGFSFTRLES